MYRPLPKELTIKNSPIEGLGLFAVEEIKKQAEKATEEAPAEESPLEEVPAEEASAEESSEEESS